MGVFLFFFTYIDIKVVVAKGGGSINGDTYSGVLCKIKIRKPTHLDMS